MHSCVDSCAYSICCTVFCIYATPARCPTCALYIRAPASRVPRLVPPYSLPPRDRHHHMTYHHHIRLQAEARESTVVSDTATTGCSEHTAQQTSSHVGSETVELDGHDISTVAGRLSLSRLARTRYLAGASISRTRVLLVLMYCAVRST